jgi:hypothetical protein
MAKAGYLYVLAHPSDPGLYKIGITTRHPEKRLLEHNTNFSEYTGRLVKETGQKWEVKTFMAVADSVLAEAAFWRATPFADVPFRGGVEVERMEWKWVEAGLSAAKKALKPPAELTPDYVYAYTAWMTKRLSGRGIDLIGRTTSRSGKSKFRCRNGHEWRASSTLVADGEGCPTCGMGTRTLTEVWKAAKLGRLFLLTHPEKPGSIKIALSYTAPGEVDNTSWGEWEIHRSRFVEDPAMAERLIWELLSQPKPADGQPVQIDLKVAEQAIRDLIYRMHAACAESARGDGNF